MTATQGQLQQAERRRVSVWFGEHVLCTYSADPLAASRYAAVMLRRFEGLRVTVDALADDTLRPLPCERLWVLSP